MNSLRNASAIKERTQQLSLAGKLTLRDAYATGIEVADNTCYLSTSGGLTIIDISNPEAISVLGAASFKLMDEIGISICIMDSKHVYLGSNHALHLYNVSDKRRPQSIKQHMFSGQLESIILQQDQLFITRNNYGFSVIDMSNPLGLPIVTAHFSGSPNPWMRSLCIEHNTAYVTKYLDNTLLLLDISKADSVSLIQSIDIPKVDPAIAPRLSSVVVANGFAYMAGGQNGLVIADVNEPEHATVVASILAKPEENGIVDVCVYDNTAYVADAESGIYVIDVTDPAIPKLTQAIAIKGGAARLRIAGNYLYCLNNQAHDSKLLVYKISD
jgi:hypothetical protein